VKPRNHRPAAAAAPAGLPEHDGYFVTGRSGARSMPALIRRYGSAVWEGGDGAPELTRAGSDPRRPWM
jgi:hypothetical protein